MAEELKVRAVFEMLFGGRKGSDEAKRALDDVKKHALGAKQSLDGVGSSAKKNVPIMQELGNSVKQMVTAFLGLFAVQRIFAFLKDSVTDFAKFERSMNALRVALRDLGLDARKELPIVEQTLRELAQGGGAALNDSIKAFQKFIGITKDVGAALEGVKLASAIAEEGNLDMAGATEQVLNVVQGRYTLALKALGVQLIDVNGKQVTAAQALDAVKQRYEAVGAEVNDTTQELSKATEAWDEIKRQTGQAVLTIAELIGGIANVVKFLRSIGPAIYLFGTAIGQFFVGVGESIASALDLKKLVTEGPSAYLAAIKSRFNAAFDVIAGDAEVRLAELSEIWGKGGAAAGASRAKEEAAAYARLRDQAGRKTDAKEDAEAAARAEKERERAEQLLKERLAFERQAQQELLQTRIKAAKDGSETELKLELEALETMRKFALEQAVALKADQSVIEENFRLARLELIKAHDEQEIESEREKIDRIIELNEQLAEQLLQAELEQFELATEERRKAELDALDAKAKQDLDHAQKDGRNLERVRALWDKRRTNLEREQAREREEIAREEMQRKLDYAFNLAHLAVGLGRAVFGENKAIAIAETIINTAEGVARAVGEQNYAAAALIAATGAAQLIKIRSTEPGSGGVNVGGGSLTSSAAPAASSGPRVLVGAQSERPWQQTESGSTREGAGAQVAGARETLVVQVGTLINEKRSLTRLSRTIKSAAESDLARKLR